MTWNAIWNFAWNSFLLLALAGPGAQGPPPATATAYAIIKNCPESETRKDSRTWAHLFSTLNMIVSVKWKSSAVMNSGKEQSKNVADCAISSLSSVLSTAWCPLSLHMGCQLVSTLPGAVWNIEDGLKFSCVQVRGENDSHSAFII